MTCPATLQKSTVSAKTANGLPTPSSSNMLSTTRMKCPGAHLLLSEIRWVTPRPGMNLKLQYLICTQYVRWPTCPCPCQPRLHLLSSCPPRQCRLPGCPCPKPELPLPSCCLCRPAHCPLPSHRCLSVPHCRPSLQPPCHCHLLSAHSRCQPVPRRHATALVCPRCCCRRPC